MNFLIPATSHIITWAKQNLLDTTTYYAQAVIRDVRENTILSTVNLTDLGSSTRFSGTWNVVQDASGFGREISIIITIYEDSAYTTVSGVYGAWETRYLIYDLKRVGGTGGQGGSSTDYAAIRHIVENTMRAVIKDLPAPKDIDLSEITGELGDVKQTMRERIKALLTLGKKADSWAEAEKRMIAFIGDFTKAAKDAKDAIVAESNNARDTIQAAVEDAKSSISESSGNSVNEIAAASESNIELMAQAVADYVDRMKTATDILVEECADKISETLSKPLHLEVVQKMDLVRQPKGTDMYKNRTGGPENQNFGRSEKISRLLAGINA